MRYEHALPGDLLHIDIKKFARIVQAGPERSRRDHTRIAFTAMYPNEQAVSAADFLAKAHGCFARFGVWFGV